MRIALIGANGQLASDLIKEFEGLSLSPFNREQVDLCRPETFESQLTPGQFDLVVNTAAYNLVDVAESAAEDAFAVNSVGVGNLARYCGQNGLPLVHFSTDYVFGIDAHPGRPWTEVDPPGPVSVYGNSKLAGEFAVRMFAPDHLIIRTCGLYGHKGSRGKGGNFVETMLKLGRAGKALRVVSDQYCTPSFTADVARATSQLIDRQARGIVHVTNSGWCTWHELAQAIFKHAGLTVDCQPITSAEYGSAARRPPYSVLCLDRLSSLVGEVPPHWEDALANYLSTRPAT